MRQGNLSKVLRLLSLTGPTSRQAIAERSQLGISTMTELIGELKSRGLVKELDPVRRTTAGRPARPIDIDGAHWVTLGMQIEVNRIQFHVATLGGQELFRALVPADLRCAGEQTYAVIDAAVRTQVARLPTDVELIGVEVALPAYVTSPRGEVSWSSDLDWHDFRLTDMLDKTLADVGVSAPHITLANDTHLAALYAARIECRPPAVDAVYLGGIRGLGSGIIINGEIYRGRSGGAGDMPHRLVDPGGERCWCGRRGCLITKVGLVYLLRDSGLLTKMEDLDHLADHDPGRGSQLLLEAAARKDPRVLSTLEAAAVALGQAVDDLIGLFNPEVVMIGGHLGVVSEHLMPTIQRLTARRRSISTFGDTRLLPLTADVPRVLLGATLAARAACFSDPLGLTRPLT